MIKFNDDGWKLYVINKQQSKIQFKDYLILTRYSVPMSSIKHTVYTVCMDICIIYLKTVHILRKFDENANMSECFTALSCRYFFVLQ